MEWHNVKVSKEDKAALEVMAEKEGVSVAEVLRRLIRSSREQRIITDELKQIRTEMKNLADSLPSRGQGKEIADTLQLVIRDELRAALASEPRARSASDGSVPDFHTYKANLKK